LANPTLPAVISRIQGLINKPPLTITLTDENIKSELEQAQTKIIRLEQELSESPQEPSQKVNDTPQGVCLEFIKNVNLNSLEQELGIKLSEEIKEAIKKTKNYQELSLLRNREIKRYLEKNQGQTIITQPTREVVNQPKGERIIWISLLVVSLMVIGGLLVKIKRSRLKKV
jgi:hypothetical protein